MSDIFISYASADRERTSVLARALEARGWSVWWDRVIPPGRQFDEVIEEALDASRCVVVLWSKASTASNWVKTEAAEAMRRKALIPALIDAEVKIPLEFRRLQAADLARWNGEASTPEFDQFCAAIASNIAAPGPGPAPAPPQPPTPAPPKSKRMRNTWIAVGAVVLVGLASLVSEYGPERPLPVPLPDPTPALPPATLASPNKPVALNMNLVWRDYVLQYSGKLSWDGHSNTAGLSVDIVDSGTRKDLGSRQLEAYPRLDAPGRLVFATQVPVPGDSRTAGPHSHDVNLVFEMQANGNWVFVRNCMTPGNCYETVH